MRHTMLGVITLIALTTTAHAATVTVPATNDASLIEDSSGALASGAGELLFAGRTALPENSVRRAVVRFDLADALSEIQANPMAIQSVALVLTNPLAGTTTPAEFRLHRVLADWGEGTSASAGGIGAPSTANDATWIHRFYPDVFWMHNGGQFAGRPSARLVLTEPGVYRFEGEGLLRDVRRWLAHPAQNFGWILIGDETRPQTARAFVSRERPDPTQQPVLEITYRGRP